MTATTPGSPTSASAPTAADDREPQAGADRGEPQAVTTDASSLEDRARAMLERLGKGDHPDAGTDPIHALYQVAIDFRCSAHGYRELYLHHVRTTPGRGPHAP